MFMRLFHVHKFLILVLIPVLSLAASCDDECVEPLPVECPSCCIAYPAAIDFGSVYVGDAVDTTFTITSICTDSVDIDVSESCDQLGIVTGEGTHRLEPGDQVTVQIRYAPLQPGDLECVIETGNGIVADVLCTGSCEDPSECEITPGGLHFGTVTVGDAPEMTFTIRNIGSGYLVGEVYEECDEFRIVAGGGEYRIAAGDSVNVTVRYTPPDGEHHVCAISLGYISCEYVICDGTGIFTWRPELISDHRLFGIFLFW